MEGLYETIAIKERTNPVCRRNHMPKKYWKHLTEMHLSNEDPDAQARLPLPSALSADRVRALADRREPAACGPAGEMTVVEKRGGFLLFRPFPAFPNPRICDILYPIGSVLTGERG